jgi:protease I
MWQNFSQVTTALTNVLELTGWLLTCLWMGNYYRTYTQTLQGEVEALLADPKDFIPGPFALKRDSADNLQLGFFVQDGNYLSARWPGDSHRFATEFACMLSR